MESTLELVQRLLLRLERKTEEIQALRAKLARLEDERSQIRQQIMEYFAEDIESGELNAEQAEQERLFGSEGYVPKTEVIVPRSEFPRELAVPGEQLRGDRSPGRDVAGPKSLSDAADAVGRLGGEVDARRLAEELGISFDGARLRLARACSAGLLKRTRLGRYVVANRAEQEDDITF